MTLQEFLLRVPSTELSPRKAQQTRQKDRNLFLHTYVLYKIRG